MVVHRAPLTFGQLSEWRNAEILPRERWHEANVTSTIALPRPVDRPTLQRAIADLIAKHEALRTVLDTSVDPPEQLLRPVSEPVDLQVVADGARELSAWSSRPFDLGAEIPFRALAELDPSGADMCTVHLCLHHLAADGWSHGLLISDLLALLGLGGTPLPRPAQSLSEVAVEQRTSNLWRAKLASTERYFRSIYEADSAALPLPAPGLDEQLALESRRLATAAQRVAADSGAPLPAVFTTAYADALAVLIGSGPIRVGLMSANRFSERTRHLLTSMNQLIPVLVPADAKQPMSQRLAAVQALTLRAYRLGIHDVDRVTPVALGLPEPIGPRHPIQLNFMAGATAEYLDGETLTVHPEPVPDQAVAGCYLRVYHVADEAIRLRLRTSGWPPGRAGDLLADIVRRVVDAAEVPTDRPLIR